MKKFTLLPLMLLSVAVFAQGAFEGVITMTTTNAEIKETTEVTWYLKGERSRMDMRSTTPDYTTEYALISDAKGMDMVAQGQVTPVPASEIHTSNATMTLLEESKGQRVNGFDCIKRTYTDGTNDITYWLATGTGIGFNDLPLFLRRNMPRLDPDQFPVKMEKRDAEGRVLMTQDVASVRTQIVEDRLFERR
ncbi:MAG: DUF4412 domain-containing protein [Flavobacteriales bacterium]|nr:DUF4412 domain-containing protein [Flavobacteriales bacterium]